MQLLRTKIEEDPLYHVCASRVEKKSFGKEIFFLDPSFPAMNTARDECTKSTLPIIVFHSMKAKRTSEYVHSGQLGYQNCKLYLIHLKLIYE